MLDAVTSLRCLICHRSYRSDEIDYVCPRHGVEGIVDVEYDYERIAATVRREDLASAPGPGMWRYSALLPIDSQVPRPPLLVGDTPLVPAPRLAAEVGVRRVWVKDEGRQPTASLKDRASAMAAVKALEKPAVDGDTLGTSLDPSSTVITTASTGNAAAALAGICASMAIPAVIFVPASAPAAKVAQLLAFGASVMLVDGPYDTATDLCMAAAARHGWYNRNTGFNPYMTEGKKTAAYEVAEALHWDAPDAVVVSVGDGCIIGGLHKGFRDLLALGWIDRMPRLIGVQAEGRDYLVRVWESGSDVLTTPAIIPTTVADSISAGLPRDRIKGLAAVTATHGVFVRVSDDEILAAIPDLARLSGVFAEPAASAALAGLRKASDLGHVGPGDRVVLMSTGSGLKDVGAATAGAAAVGARPIEVAPDDEAVERALAEHHIT